MVASVMLGELGEILRLGLREVLADAGVAVVADVTVADAVLIDLDAVDVCDRAAELADSFPDVTIIACSAERPAMQVLSGASAAEELPLSQRALSATVRAAASARRS